MTYRNSLRPVFAFAASVFLILNPSLSHPSSLVYTFNQQLEVYWRGKAVHVWRLCDCIVTFGVYGRTLKNTDVTEVLNKPLLGSTVTLFKCVWVYTVWD